VQNPHRSILVVDDDPLTRLALTRSLQRAGYAVASAASAEAGLELLRETTFSCAITDWYMPGLGGRGFLLAAAERAPGLPVLLISGNALLAGLTGGFAYLQVLPKPWHDADLRALVARAVSAGDGGVRPRTL